MRGEGEGMRELREVENDGRCTFLTHVAILCRVCL